MAEVRCLVRVISGSSHLSLWQPYCPPLVQGAFQHLHCSFIVPYTGSAHFKDVGKNCSITHGNFTLFWLSFWNSLVRVFKIRICLDVVGSCIKLTGSNFFIFIFLTARFIIFPLGINFLKYVFLTHVWCITIQVTSLGNKLWRLLYLYLSLLLG